MCFLCLRCILDKNKVPVLELSKNFACLPKILIHIKKISLVDSVLWPKTVVQKNSFRLISQDRIGIYDSYSGWLRHKFPSEKLLIILWNFMNIFYKEYLLSCRGNHVSIYWKFTFLNYRIIKARIQRPRKTNKPNIAHTQSFTGVT